MPPTYKDYKLCKVYGTGTIDSLPSELFKIGYIPFGSPVYNNDRDSIFQAFVLPVEKPSESKNIHVSTEVENLIEKIKSTNNGYLFAPSESEIELAKKNSTIFKYLYDEERTFPHRISLKSLE